MSHSRKPFVGGNWKSNGTTKSITDLMTALTAGATNWSQENVEVVLAPAALHISITQSLLKTPKFAVASQNVSAYPAGAYTGEWTAEMLKDVNVHWSLVGHSERRHKFHESFSDTAAKISRCQTVGINVIFCIGELLEERNAGKTIDVCRAQIEAILDAVKDWSKIVIAYEPVWAIGTGVVATTEQAQEAHYSVRDLIRNKVNSEVADSVRILYGGSVTPENCSELIACPDVDGFLVGGASLKSSFTDIIIAAGKSNL